MNRERAETHLRMLAEAELRDPRARTPGPASPYVATERLPARVVRVAWALAAVRALDVEIAEGILADLEMAMATRRPELTGPGVMSAVATAWVSGPVSYRLSPVRFPGLSPLARIRRAVPGVAIAGPPPAGGSAPATAPRAGSVGVPDRYVPVGLVILFHDQTVSGELGLMSYAHTAAGARLFAAWQARDPMGSRYDGLPPVDRFEVTDDRGARYELDFSTGNRPGFTCDLCLRPDPPEDIRWLDVTAPGEAAVRVNLDPGSSNPKPEVSETGLSAGEHLLNRIAERLLTMAPEFPQDLWLQLAAVTPGPLSDLARRLGDVVAALEAAEVLSPLSPVPGRLAALCASLRISGHGITAAPALDLPEPWLSLLAHYHRRKPDSVPARDGFAAVAAALPELDGLGLVLLGLHNSDGDTWMNVMALGPMRDHQRGPLDLDLAFPLSVWIRDSAGRWHFARPTGWHHDDGSGENVLTLRLVPPLTRPTAWIEVLVAGQSAEVRAKLPLRWGYPP